MLRLLLYDYLWTARYYTIYRTFKRWSSDDFTTIPRLFHDYFIGETTTIGYDYCSPLLAIGRKPEKSCGGSRQWFRAARRAPAAGLPRRVEGASRCALTADRCQIESRRADPVRWRCLPLSRCAGFVLLTRCQHLPAIRRG